MMVETVGFTGGLEDLTGLYIPPISVGRRSGGVEAVPASGVCGRPGWVYGEFIRGPLPLAWWGRVCRLPGGKTLAVALAIWFLAGLRGRTHDLKLTSAVLKRFGVEDRSAKSRALEALEGAGLIRVERRPGRNPLVTILEIEGVRPAA